MQSPTNTRAFTFLALVTWMAWCNTFSIWVRPPRQNTRVIRRNSSSERVSHGLALNSPKPR